MSAEVPRAIREKGLEAARKLLDWYYEVFGPENFFFELQEHDIPELERSTASCGARQALQRALHRHQRRALHQPRRCAPAGYPAGHPDRLPVSDPNRLNEHGQLLPALARGNGAPVRRSARGAQQHAADRRTLQCGPVHQGLPPAALPVPEGYTAETYLRELCEEGLARRYGEHAEDAEVRSAWITNWASSTRWASMPTS